MIFGHSKRCLTAHKLRANVVCMRMVFPIFFVCALACESKPPTWGDYIADFSDTYCTTLAKCGYENVVQICVEHTYWHLCSENRSCDVNMSDLETKHSLEECLEDLAKTDGDRCYYLGFWGFLPKSCYEFFRHAPKPH
jgi:hypothetical protein